MKQYLFDPFHERLGDTREQKAFYLAAEVDARIDGYVDLLRRTGIALAAEEGPAKKAFVTKLFQDMHDFNTVDVNDERLGRIAELEKALRDLNDLCANASRNHMDIDPEVHRIVKAALGL